MKIILIIVSFIFCCICGYFIKKLLANNNIAEEVNKKITLKYERRLKELENKHIAYGNQDYEKLNKLTKFDIDLEMSGLKNKFPNLNTELLLLYITIILIAETIISTLFIKNALITIIILMLSTFFIKLVFNILINYNIKKIDDEIIEFANQLAAYSNATDDLVTILEYTIPYLKNPIKSGIENCVKECRIKGVSDEAFYRLNLKIRHRYFNMLIENLLESSKHNMNYKEVVQRANETIIVYVANKEIRKANAKGANIIIMLMLLLLIIVTIVVVKGLMKITFQQFFFSDIIGKIIFVSILFVFMFCLWKCINMGKERI